MALWRDATAGALGPGQGDYDPYGDLSSLVRQIAPGIGTAAQAALQPQLSRPDDSFAAYMADPLARTDADIQQRAAAGPPSVPQSLADLGSLVMPYLAGAAPGGSLSSGIRAWHASPYDFDKFDISKVGTGQGGATYGHGIYAAESPKVSGPGGSYDLEFTAKNLGKYDLNQGENEVLRVLRAGGSDMDALGTLARGGGYTFEEANAALERIKAAKARLYDVNINADPQQFLNWDKPLTQQSTAVQPNLTSALELHRNQVIGERLANDAAARSEGRFSWFGQGNPADVYDPIKASGNSLDKLISQMGPETATQTFQSSGIPGIRYLDQGSRGAGQGTSNYVVFDPKIIDILRKYAVPGLISGAAAGAATTGNGS